MSTEPDPTSPFPEAREGPVAGTSGLYRLHYFNGRFMTAEAEGAEQLYWDARTRLATQIHPPGVAWGLVLDVERSLPAPAVALSDMLTLGPGLAFDPAGRPIAVGGSGYGFTLEELLGRYRERPTIVERGATRFAPCPQPVPHPDAGAITAGGPPSGPYLLLIRAEERAEGEARVYGKACPDPGEAAFRHDGWRGGFALSLARYPLTLSAQDQTAEGWTLRSLVASHYFYEWEQPLKERWTADWRFDPRASTGPEDDAPGWIPLAMGYFRGGIFVFWDIWMVYRQIVSTRAEALAAHVRGAPAPAAVLARSQQFQAQLVEALAAGASGSLFEIGFRCIPPYGFLPVGLHDNIDPFALDPRTPQGRQAQVDLLEHVRSKAHAWFAGTNVLTFTTVAWREDEILPALNAAAELDPLCLTEPSSAPDNPLETLLRSTERNQGNWRGDAPRELLKQFPKSNTPRLAALNREWEEVQLIVPLEGLRRTLPVGGAFHPRSGLTERPRAFIAYVKEPLTVGYWSWLAAVAIDGLDELRIPAFWADYKRVRDATAPSIRDALEDLRSSYSDELIDYLDELYSVLGEAGFRRFMLEVEELALK